jgi:hypothetical protein
MLSSATLSYTKVMSSSSQSGICMSTVANYNIFKLWCLSHSLHTRTNPCLCLPYNCTCAATKYCTVHKLYDFTIYFEDKERLLKDSLTSTTTVYADDIIMWEPTKSTSKQNFVGLLQCVNISD